MTTLTEAALAEIGETIEHLNANHADSVLFVARYGAGCPDAQDAEITVVDAHGVEFALGDAGGSVRIDFADPIVSRLDLQVQMFSVLATAREQVGDSVGLTSLEVELATNPTLPTFIVEVAEVRELNASLLEIDLRGGLEGFTSVGGDQFVYLMVPQGDGEVIPDDWTMAKYRESGFEAPIYGAYYTVRAWDPSTSTMTIWLARHDHPTGVAAWFGTCVAGDRLALWGPRHGFGREMPGLVEADPAAQALFVSDESGIAAVAVLLEELDERVPVQVIAEAVGPAHRPVLPQRDRLDVTWIDRGDGEPGSPTALLEAVAAADIDVEHTFAFGAGESKCVSAIRRHLRREVGLPAVRVHMIGYWRTG